MRKTINISIAVVGFILLLLSISIEELSAEDCTYYSPTLIGHLMADGSPYDALRYTAAHGSIHNQPFQYPLGTILEVKHDGNTVLVELTDRHGGMTEIDLSYQSFSDLIDNLDGQGRIPVTIKEIK